MHQPRMTAVPSAALAGAAGKLDLATGLAAADVALPALAAVGFQEQAYIGHRLAYTLHLQRPAAG